MQGVDDLVLVFAYLFRKLQVLSILQLLVELWWQRRSMFRPRRLRSICIQGFPRRVRVTLWDVAVVLTVVLRLTMWLKKNEYGLMFVCYQYKQLHEVGEWFFESFSPQTEIQSIVCHDESFKKDYVLWTNWFYSISCGF